MIDLSKKVLRINYVRYPLAIIGDLVFINFLFNQLTIYLSTSIFVLISFALIGILMYKLCMFIFKLAFLNTISVVNIDDNASLAVDHIKSTKITYLSKFLFENEYFYRWLTEKDGNKQKNQISSKQAANLLNDQIGIFVKKFTVDFIQVWYRPYVSANDEFPMEAQIQLEYLFMDFFKRFTKIDKHKLFQHFAFIFNENFLNIATCNVHTNDILHPAMHNSPHSEQDYMKKCVHLILSKSSYNSQLFLGDEFIREMFLQIIGKNCLEKSMRLLTQPNFIFYAIILLCDKEYDLKKLPDNIAATKLFAATKLTPQIDRQISTDHHDRKLMRQLNIDLQGFDSETEHSVKDFDHMDSEYQSTLFDFKLNIDEALRVSESESSNYLTDENVRSDSDSTTAAHMNRDSDVEHVGSNNKAEHLSNYEIISLSISNTETDYDSKTGNPFTLFTIQYSYKFTNNGQEETKTRHLRRRHKQFVNLQKRLEENHELKSYLKHINGPSTLFSLPIGNMDEQYIQKRREKLNIYLNSLIKIPEVKASIELKSFLSLDDSNQYEQRQNSLQEDQPKKINPKSIDKLLIRTVSDMFDKITSSSTSVLSSIRKSDDSAAHVNAQHTAMAKNIDFGRLQIKFENSNSISYVDCFAKIAKYLNKFNLLNSKHVQNEKSTRDGLDKNLKADQLPALSQILVDCFIKLVLLSSSHTDCYLNNERLYQLVCAVSSRFYVERFLKDLFVDLFNEKSLSGYLVKLERVLFEKNSDDTNMSETPNPDLEAFALETVENIIPNEVRILIGKARIHDVLSTFFDSLKNPTVNRHYIYCILDITLRCLYDDMDLNS